MRYLDPEVAQALEIATLIRIDWEMKKVILKLDYVSDYERAQELKNELEANLNFGQ